MAKKVVFVKVIHHTKVILIIVKVFKCDGKIVVIKQIIVVKKKFDGKPYGQMPHGQMPASQPYGQMPQAQMPTDPPSNG